MSQIQRWSQPPGVFMTTEPDGEYVTHADHVADRAELVRLLMKYRTSEGHEDCEVIQGRVRPDWRCPLCKQVDALEGA